MWVNSPAPWFASGYINSSPTHSQSQQLETGPGSCASVTSQQPSVVRSTLPAVWRRADLEDLVTILGLSSNDTYLVYLDDYITCIPSGYVKIAIENSPVEIVDVLP